MKYVEIPCPHCERDLRKHLVNGPCYACKKEVSLDKIEPDVREMRRIEFTFWCDKFPEKEAEMIAAIQAIREDAEVVEKRDKWEKLK